MQLTTDLSTALGQAQTWWSTAQASASAPLVAALTATQSTMNPFERAANMAEVMWAYKDELDTPGLEALANLAHMCAQNFGFGFADDRRGARMVHAVMRITKAVPKADAQKVEDDPEVRPDLVAPEPPPAP